MEMLRGRHQRTRCAIISGVKKGTIILGLLTLMWACEDEITEPEDELVGTWKSTEQTIRTYITTNSDQTFVDEDSEGESSIFIPANIPTVIITVDVNTNETLVFVADGSFSSSDNNIETKVYESLFSSSRTHTFMRLLYLFVSFVWAHIVHTK